MELNELRAQIDELDRQLTALLEQRMDISAEIAAWKRKGGVPVLDPAREEQKLAAIREQCRNTTADGIEEIFQTILAASRAHQTALLGKDESGHGG